MKMIADPVSSPGNINHATDGAWTDIDVTSYVGADAGNVAGVYLRVHNSGGDNTVAGNGFRKNGSTDDYRFKMAAWSTIYVAVGVDANDVFESYHADASDFTIHLLGYWLNSEAEFLTNAQDVTPGSGSTWTNTALGSYFTGTALAACLIADGSGRGLDSSWGAQDVSGPDRYGQLRDVEGDASVVPCTGEACEIYVSSTDIKVYCTGIIKGGFTKFTESSHNFTASGSYENIDLSGDIPAGGVAVLYQHHDGTGEDTGSPDLASRADGATWDEYDNVQSLGAYMISQINTTTRIVEQKTSDDTKNSYFVAYMTEASSSTPIAAIAHHHRMLQGVG